MLLSAMAFVCVMYTDGSEHCNIQTGGGEAVSIAVCREYVNYSTELLALDAATATDVVRVTQQGGSCFSKYEYMQSAVSAAQTMMLGRGATVDVIQNYGM